MLPVFSGGDRLSQLRILRRPGERSSAIEYLGKDYSGVQFGKPSHGCAIQWLEGADAGQDLYFGVELRVPRTGADKLCSAGPYFRSRSAASGDGIIGGTSAGYAVLLRSDGEVAVRRLNPQEIVAYRPAPPGFDSGAFHSLEVAVRGEALEAALDGAALEFEQAGKASRAVSIPPGWERPRKVGTNQGAAGILFLTSDRTQAGGQQARNIVIAPYRPPGPLATH